MFNNGDVVKVNHPGRLWEHEWTVVDVNTRLLGSSTFLGHSGVSDEFKGTVWDGHCYYIPKQYWEIASPLIQENE